MVKIEKAKQLCVLVSRRKPLLSKKNFGKASVCKVDIWTNHKPPWQMRPNYKCMTIKHSDYVVTDLFTFCNITATSWSKCYWDIMQEIKESNLAFNRTTITCALHKAFKEELQEVSD